MTKVAGRVPDHVRPSTSDGGPTSLMRFAGNVAGAAMVAHRRSATLVRAMLDAVTEDAQVATVPTATSTVVS